MREMEQVTRYKCKWCGKEFKTPDRHDCKWDPDAFNCLSCKHRGPFVKGIPTKQTGFGKWEEGMPDSFECANCEPAQGWWNDFAPITGASTINHDKHCPEYERIENYMGKETFKKIEQSRPPEKRELTIEDYFN